MDYRRTIKSLTPEALPQCSRPVGDRQIRFSAAREGMAFEQPQLLVRPPKKRTIEARPFQREESIVGRWAYGRFLKSQQRHQWLGVLACIGRRVHRPFTRPA